MVENIDKNHSLVNGEVTSRYQNKANSLDFVWESLKNDKKGNTVSEKLAVIVRKH